MFAFKPHPDFLHKFVVYKGSHATLNTEEWRFARNTGTVISEPTQQELTAVSSLDLEAEILTLGRDKLGIQSSDFVACLYFIAAWHNRHSVKVTQAEVEQLIFEEGLRLQREYVETWHRLAQRIKNEELAKANMQDLEKELTDSHAEFPALLDKAMSLGIELHVTIDGISARLAAKKEEAPLQRRSPAEILAELRARAARARSAPKKEYVCVLPPSPNFSLPPFVTTQFTPTSEPSLTSSTASSPPNARSSLAP